ncbi:telomerase reverse transcriptase isoform X2 [Syngnathus typhle]|uniref:telomerase reverse transcriptase isoform X2 n=1 Tax=Syngnathus typhle TaxID=161592 RepID=UPI002A6A4354|nr:telomerase reverse transcriptase isoform X2 [Syngnathus typhle]
MFPADRVQVLGLLRSLYEHTCTLEELTDKIVFREGHKLVLVEQADTDLFKSFLSNIFVAYDNELQQAPSCRLVCTFAELLAFILNSLARKKKRNVLSLGFKLPFVDGKELDNDNFKFHGEVTHNILYLKTSELWNKVAKRVGTDITRHLLESCSLFVVAPPTCAVQICGTPIYDRVSKILQASTFSPRFRSCGNARSVKNRCAVRLKRRDFRAFRGKRKRESNEDDKDEIVCSGKRRRLTEVHKVKKTVEDGHSLKYVETSTTVSKQAAGTSTGPMKGAPSWRSGVCPPLPPSRCFVQTLAFLYGGRGMNGFLLNRKRKSAAGLKSLLGQDVVRLIFFEGLQYLNGVERKPKKLPRRFFNMISLFSQLLSQHKKYAYNRTLRRLCPLVHCDLAQAELSSLLAKHCTPHQVYLFVRECLCAVVPLELWGSAGNRSCFLARVRGFLRSGKFDKLSVAELLWKMKVNDCDWLKISKKGWVPPSELSYRTRVLGQLLAWLLDGYVVDLVRACFYVTEGVGQKNALRFYRHDVWDRLQELAFRSYISKGQLEELTSSEVTSLPKSTVISRLRFIPKTDSMRPIMRVLGQDTKSKAYRKDIRNLKDVLQACVQTNPSLLGSTVWDMTEIHKVLSTLLPDRKEHIRKLYFVKMDVSGAYESLPHKKLLHMVREVLSPFQHKTFITHCYAKIWANSIEGLKKSFSRQGEFLVDDRKGIKDTMNDLAIALQRSNKVHHAILVEQYSQDIRVKDMLQVFNLMLTGSVLRFGNKLYRRLRGIPQGSVASALLCCLCYGHMENTLLKGVVGSKGRLMRLVDDFLLITPHLHEAQTFFRVLMASVPQYGLVVNPQKVLVNFPLPQSLDPQHAVRILNNCLLFPWCGLLLDTSTLDVYKDYSRYSGMFLRHSLTLRTVPSAGKQMRMKLMQILRLKCHPLFLDLKTNLVTAVYKNLYELVFLQALRFHVCAQSLPFGQTVAKNPFYFLRMVWDMAHYTSHLISQINKGYEALGSLVPDQAVELLFCLSFSLVLSQHRAAYKVMGSHLQKRKCSLERRLGGLQLGWVRQAAKPSGILGQLNLKGVLLKINKNNR